MYIYMCICSVCLCERVRIRQTSTGGQPAPPTPPHSTPPPTPPPISSHTPPPHTHSRLLSASSPPLSWRPGMREKAVVNKKFSKNGMKREVKLSGPGHIISSLYGSWPLAGSPTLSDREGVAGSVTITAPGPKQMICLSEASKGSNYT